MNLPPQLSDALAARLTDHSWETLQKIVEDFKTLVSGTMIPNNMPLIPLAFVVMRTPPDNNPLPGPYMGLVILDPTNFPASFLLLRQSAHAQGASGVVCFQEVARVAEYGPADPSPVDVTSDPRRQRALMISVQHESGEMEMWNSVHLHDNEYTDWEEVSENAMVPGYMLDLVRTAQATH